jgi:crotonobetaine/carnitine-CoA ligase
MGSFPSRSECVVRDLLNARAEGEPNRVFAVFADGTEWTLGETAERSWRCAGGYRQLGLAQREPVAAWLPNGQDALVAWFGAAAAGLTYVPLNTAYRGALLEDALNVLRARTLVAHAALLDRLAGLDLPHLERLVVVGGDPTEVPAGLPPALSWADVSAAAEPAPPELPDPVEPWDEHMVMFTGGTTGRSKAVRRPYVLYLKMAEAAFDNVGIGADDRFFVCAPMFHGGADVPIYAMLRAGGSVAIVPSFRTQTFWDDVRRLGCTVAWIHSAMARFLWDAPPRHDDRDNPLRLAMQAPLLPTFREFGERFDTRIYTVYGMTELPCPFSIPDPVDHRTLGKPWTAEYEIDLFDEHDRPVAEDVPGELVARHRVPWAITPGYLGDPEATARSWRNGWFHSGDLFVRDAEGDYAIVGRVKDSIRRRGENVSAADVERELVAHPGVADAAVIGIAADVEQEVMAFVVPSFGEPPSPEDVIAFLEPRLPYYAVPRYLDYVESLPRTPALRIDKAALGEQGVSETTWDREAAGIRLRRERLA